MAERCWSTSGRNTRHPHNRTRNPGTGDRSQFKNFTVSIPSLKSRFGVMFICGKLADMRVFGIDCGTEITGYGVVGTCEPGLSPRVIAIAMGEIRLSKAKSLPERLEQVYREVTAELERWQPDAVAIEEVFYSVNAKSALKLGQVRGVALLAAACQRLPIAEYAPLRIKSSVVGYGLADKGQGQFMVGPAL